MVRKSGFVSKRFLVVVTTLFHITGLVVPPRTQITTEAFSVGVGIHHHHHHHHGSLSTVATNGRGVGNQVGQQLLHRRHPGAAHSSPRFTATSTNLNSQEETSSSSTVAYQDATTLLEEVLDYVRRPSTETDNDNNNNKAAARQQKMESLIQKLCNNYPTTTYNPSEALTGPLYCTLYTYTPKSSAVANSTTPPPPPLWERISLKSDNLKGQQYLGETLINYAEIWGSFVHLRATGVYAPLEPNTASSSSSSSLSTLRSCPDQYQVQATRAYIFIAGKSIALPIQGSAMLVVGYADPRIRIFLSPISSDSAYGTWENAGLVAVQVRSDLVTRDGTMIDLQPSMI
jgi:hypothetical protein